MKVCTVHLFASYSAKFDGLGEMNRLVLRVEEEG